MAKYSFETTTIGDMLDTPELFTLLSELVPEAIDHPMLDVGRPFTLEQALPFIEAIADSMGITNVEERIADFKEKLEALE
ncbi:MAG: hypothetical protein IKJ88_02415 [Clostridia bacterium]|nr:hypothetical protein [Clostridia bacterium]MBR3974693.1 hypothetical protein [Clostridia bacterium]